MGTLHLRHLSDLAVLNSIETGNLLALLRPYSSYFESRGVLLSEAKFAIAEQTLLDPLGVELGQDDLTVNRPGIAEVLHTPDENTPPELVDALYLIDEMATSDGMERLLQADDGNDPLDFGEEPTPADVAVRFFLGKPRLLERKHAEQFIPERRSFETFLSRVVQSVQVEIDSVVLERIEGVLSSWFVARKKGAFVRVVPHIRGEQTWFLVRHGDACRREGALCANLGHSVFYRPERCDIVIYDSAMSELRINAGTKGEKDLYRLVFGLRLLGDQDYFLKTAQKYTLEPLRDGPDSLACNDIHGLMWVKLTEIAWSWGGSPEHIESHKGDDVLSLLASQGKQIPRTRIVRGRFQFSSAGSRATRSATIQLPAVARYTRDSDGQLIDEFLRRRGFLLERPGNLHEKEQPALASA